MSQVGANLQTCNQELVKCLEHLKTKRDEINDTIQKEEAEKQLIEKKIQELQNKLNSVDKNLCKNTLIRDHYERLIAQTEDGFKRILETGQTLLNVAKQESGKLENSNKNEDLNFNGQDNFYLNHKFYK